MVFRPLLKTVVAGIVIVSLILFIDTIVGVLSFARDIVANEGGVNSTTVYSDIVSDIVGGLAWVTLLILGGILLVYGIHVRRR